MLSQQSDAGRKFTHPGEHNDCTVVALANAAGISYKDAHEFAAQVGRRPRHGMKTKTQVKEMLRNVDISGIATTRQLTVPEPVRSGYRFNGYFSRRVPRQGISL